MDSGTFPTNNKHLLYVCVCVCVLWEGGNVHVYRKLGAGRVPAAVLLTTVRCAPWGRLRVFKQVPQHTFAMQIHYRGKGNCPQLTETEAELAKLVLYSNRWASWSSFSFPVFKMLSSAMQSSTFPPFGQRCKP